MFWNDNVARRKPPAVRRSNKKQAILAPPFKQRKIRLIERPKVAFAHFFLAFHGLTKIAAMVTQHFAHGGQEGPVNLGFRLPERRSHDGLCTMQIRLFYLNPKDSRWQFRPDAKALQKLRVIANFSTTVHPQNFFDARDQEYQANRRVDEDIAKPIETIIPRAIWQEESLFIENVNKSRPFTPWRGIAKTVFAKAR